MQLLAHFLPQGSSIATVYSLKPSRNMIIAISFRLAAILISHLASASLISVKNITTLGSQLTPDVTHVSRDGGYSALINGKIVFFYDDTECMDLEGNQLSFVSNTAAYASDPKKDIRSVQDFGVVNVGVDRNGSPKRAILADSTVETGGWIPFIEDELTFNQQKKGKERVAICMYSSCACCLLVLILTCVIYKGLVHLLHLSALYKHSCSLR